MRLVRIHTDADRPLELVPTGRVCVVAVDPVARERLAAVLGQAFVLAGTELTGTVDAGDYLTPLDPTAVVALDLPGDGLPVLDASDLPRPDPALARRRREQAEAVLTATTADLEQVTAAAADAERRDRATRAAVAVGEQELAAATATRDELADELAALADRPATIEQERQECTAAMAACRRRLDELEAVAAAVRDVWASDGALGCLRLGGAHVDHPAGAPPAVLAAVVGRAVSAEALPDEVTTDLRAWLDGVEAGTAAPHPRAVDVADRAAAVDEAWARASELGVEGEAGVVTARGDLARRRAELDDLERLAADGLLGEHLRAEVEAAHGTADELEVLARYGFDSYLDFTIALSTRSVGRVAEERLAAVRDAVAGCEARLATARTAAAAELDRLAAEREAHVAEATGLLRARPDGPVGPAVLLLPAVPEEVAAVPVLVGVASGAVRDELTGAVAALDRLAAEEDGLDARRDQVEERLRRAAERVDGVAALLDRARPAAEAAAERHASAAASLAASQAALEAATGQRRWVEQGDDGLGPDELREVADAVVALVAGRSAGRVPVVMDEVLRPLGADGAAVVLGALAAAAPAPAPQVLYLTEDQRLADWARHAEGLGLVELRRPGWLRRHVGRLAHRA